MSVVDAFGALQRTLIAEWRGLRLADLQFAHARDAQLMLLALLGLTVVLLVARLIIGAGPGRQRLALPALFPSQPRSLAPWFLHLPLLAMLTGLPFLALALAGPYSPLVQREATYPGRRICLTIDASNSMTSAFRTETLKTQSDTDQAFFTTIAAAERFVQMRRNGRFRDLLALVEFGTDAYVITPFTNDYDNILLSLSLIGEPHEFASFPDQRTLIARGIEESVALFKAFNYLDASGNMLVIFSDGEDTNAAVHGRSIDDIIREAVEAGVPVYMVRTMYDKRRGEYIPDNLWSEAVEKSGGKFFAASDERTLLQAIAEIDQASAGTIRTTEYAAQRPQFAVFAAMAALCFVVAIAAKLTVPYFQKLP